MTDSPMNVRHELERIDHSHWDVQHHADLLAALTAAQTSADEQLEYEVRIRLISSANNVGDMDLMLTCFAWCLAHHDQDAARFPQSVGPHDLLWQFKWMTPALRASTKFSRQQIDAVLEDMSAHFQRANAGTSAVLMARFDRAVDAGHIAEAEDLLTQLRTVGEDEYSHCEACALSTFASFAVSKGEDDEAIALVEQMLQGDLGCMTEPEHALSTVMLPYLRAGNLDAAREAHLRSYRFAQFDPDRLATAASHVVFATVTGNADRALAMTERHLPWLAHDRLNEAAQLRGLAAFALALDAVVQEGQGSAAIRGITPAVSELLATDPDRAWSIQELAPVLWAKAREIAIAFDERDGTRAHTARLQRIEALRKERYDLPLHTGSAPLKAVRPSVPRSGAEWFARAESLADFGDLRSALDAALRAMNDETLPEELALRARGIEVGARVGLDDIVEAGRAQLDRLELLRTAGRWEEVALERRFGLALHGHTAGVDVQDLLAAAEEPERTPLYTADLYLAAGALLVEEGELTKASEYAWKATDVLIEIGRAERAASILSVLAALDLALDPEAALVAANHALAIDSATAGARARALRAKALAVAVQGDVPAAVTHLDEALALAHGIGARDGVLELMSLGAQLLRDAGNLTDACARYQAAADAADREHDPAASVLRFQQGALTLQLGDAGSAIDIFDTVLAAEERDDTAPGSRAQTAAALAQALEADGDPGGAVRAWYLAQDLFAEANDEVSVVHTQLHLGRILGQHGREEEALELLRPALTAAQQWTEHRDLQLRALQLMGQAAGLAGLAESLTYLDQAEALATELDDAWNAADITDSRARYFARVGDIDRAVAAALRAADAFAALGEASMTAGSELFAARTLVFASRAADAVPAYRAVLEHATDEPLRQVAAIELGDALTSLGRHAEATEVRDLLEP